VDEEKSPILYLFFFKRPEKKKRTWGKKRTSFGKKEFFENCEGVMELLNWSKDKSGCPS